MKTNALEYTPIIYIIYILNNHWNNPLQVRNHATNFSRKGGNVLFLVFHVNSLQDRHKLWSGGRRTFLRHPFIRDDARIAQNGDCRHEIRNKGIMFQLINLWLMWAAIHVQMFRHCKNTSLILFCPFHFRSLSTWFKVYYQVEGLNLQVERQQRVGGSERVVECIVA